MTRSNHETTVMPPAAALLLWCARPVQDTATVARLQALAAQITDWDTLVKLAWRHGILPLVARNLAALPPGVVPATTLAALQTRYRDHAQQAMRLTGELCALLAAFDAAGIAAIPYKGPVLALLAYDNLSLRQFRDLDLLVQPNDVERATAVLTARGYHQLVPFTPVEARLARQANCEYEFHRADGTLVELHWALFSPYVALSFDQEVLRSRLRSVRLGGQTVETFALVDLLLIHCAHGGYHSWERIEWIADIAALLTRHPAIAWETLLTTARRIGALRFLLLGLWLAGDWLGAPLPPAVLAQAKADRQVQRIATEVQAALLAEPRSLERAGRPIYVFNLAIRERWQDRLRYWLSRTFQPTVEDAKALALPLPLLPLYTMLRPLRLLGLLVRRLVQRLLPAKPR